MSARARSSRAIGMAGVVSLCLVSCNIPSPPDLPIISAGQRQIWLDQGWTDEQRQWYHHASQGTSTIPVPYSWFLALERPEVSVASAGRLSDPDYLERFGFIRGKPHPQHNPDGLPVGFARSRNEDPVTGRPVDQLGLTCAACHTAQIDYEGTSLLVDGGPALLDLGAFREALAISVGLTLKLPLRFRRFSDRVLGTGHSKNDAEVLKQGLARFMKGVAEVQQIEAGHQGRNVTEGFGRLDALNRIGNEVFGMQMGLKENVAPRTAPVAFPHLWSTAWFDWVQYNGSIEQPMVRNAGEAMGVRALVNYKQGATPTFTSTIPIDNLYAMEKQLGGRPPLLAERRFNGLKAPEWPREVLPPINAQRADRGAELYRQHCQNCHLPPVKSEAFWSRPGGGNPGHWTRPNQAGEQYLRLRMIPVAQIGTDPAQAVGMEKRTVTAPAELGLTGEIGASGTARTYAFGPALGQVVEKVVNRWYDSRTPALGQAERDRMNGHRPNGIRAGIPGPGGTDVPAYKARPLDGIWATAPYLHNGSVPTLYDLLSPIDERPSIFHLGSRQFDPVKVGYRTEQVPGAFLFDTSKSGNSKQGHLFDAPGRGAGVIGPRFSPEDRAALVEFLKTL